MKNHLQDKMKITYFLTASKNIDFDHVCHVIVYRYFLSVTVTYDYIIFVQ